MTDDLRVPVTCRAYTYPALREVVVVGSIDDARDPIVERRRAD